MGSYKALKEVRRIVLDCMKNIHPIYRIKVWLLLEIQSISQIYLCQELMVRRELAKDPKLANESWDRFLPQFRKRHLKTSEKTAKKNDALVQKVEARKAAGLDTSVEEVKKELSKKKVYTPFPPAQLPRKVDPFSKICHFFLTWLSPRWICNSNLENISLSNQTVKRGRLRRENKRYG